MGDIPKGDFSTSSLHINMLQEALGSGAPTSLIYSYGKSFNGFVAMLTHEEMVKVAGMDGVVSVFPNEKYRLQTTRSWDFMGFSEEVNRATLESDIIIGVLDTGIWPESDSFKDTGFGPPPSKWKGTCETSLNFTCNNKVIGAQFYRSNGTLEEDDILSPRDTNGHGTHTASTAAGGLVSMASLYGLGSGTARGGVPGARIAVYKICWADGCYDADILAAFDDAIADGVDIISLSVAGHSPKPYFNDSIAIGSFHAMRNGMLTSTAGGNDGPATGTVTNVAPWFLSVAASTIDRKFFTRVQLGNNNVYEGISINTFEAGNYTHPMIYGGDAPNTTGNFNGSTSRYCGENSLNPDLVNGSIVLCDALTNGEPALLAGAAGIVMEDSGLPDTADSFPLPATVVGAQDGTAIYSYINLTSDPTATIFKSYAGNDTQAPYVASFSSRGPNKITPDILKPDLAAPGVDILAAWPLAAVTRVKEDRRRTPFNIISGTSMACPHASAVAAYIKSFQPSWSPAAIKSAMMTTASPMSVETSPEAEFAYGAGHLNPAQAVNPGLVYDVEAIDYIEVLCGEGYSTGSLRLVTGDSSTCSAATSATVWDLNLPSFTLSTSSPSFSQTFNRTVINVGAPSSTYTATVVAPQALGISVEPAILTFTAFGQKSSFTVTVEGAIASSTIASASLVWDDGIHQVRSPIVVYSL
ncbi:cucumisin-like [Diospyros lotus]|uniref:cucumisin-like n=1 Tax=Diospyros lotus TaxID=55363 RepID=UPI002255F93B|nr:cucumisin-like [Diospyros lotus]